MSDDIESLAKLLTEVLYISTDGRPMEWRLPSELNEMTAKAIALAVDRGWMLIGVDNGICLTDAGRDLIRRTSSRRIPQG